jgi:CRP-like cAMP-binding protein
MLITEALSSTKRKDPARLWAGVLQEIPIFSGVPKRHVKKIAALTREVRYQAGSTIVRAGEPGDDFFVVLDGTAAVRRRGLASLPLGPGSYFGEMALIDGKPRSASVVAETNLLCLRLSRKDFLRVLRSEPEVDLALLRHLAGRIRELQAHAHMTA